MGLFRNRRESQFGTGKFMGSQANPENKGECFYSLLGGNCRGDCLKKTSWRRMRIQDCCHFSLAISSDLSVVAGAKRDLPTFF